MTQLALKNRTFKRLNILKVKGTIIREDEKNSLTWDCVVSAAVDVCEKHPDDFLLAIRTKEGKTRNGVNYKMEKEKEEEKKAEVINEKIKSGARITSKELESMNPQKTFKEAVKDGGKEEQYNT